MDKNASCEYCGEDVDYTEPTSFHGPYCLDCLKITMGEDKEAVNKIKKARRQEMFV